MFKRILFLIFTKIQSVFLKSIAFTARVEYSKVSKKAKIWRYAILSHSSVDDYTYIGPNSRVIYAKIGKYCSISSNCAIGMGTHCMEYKSTSPIFTSPHNDIGTRWTKESFFHEYKEVNIGNDVWIGQRVMVMGGVQIGDGAVVGAGAVVTKDVPPYAIVAGVPAKIIRYRFEEETIKELLHERWWDKSEKELKENIYKFQIKMK